MTATSTALVASKLAPHHSREETLRALDHMLARRYVAHIVRRNQIALERQIRQGTLVYRPRIEICDDPSSSRIIATIEIPGMRSEDVELHLEKGEKLLVSGDRRPPHLEANVRYPTKEIKYGRFQREIDVPKGTLASTISASMADGLLTLSWPRKPSGATAYPNASASDSHLYVKGEGTSSA